MLHRQKLQFFKRASVLKAAAVLSCQHTRKWCGAVKRCKIAADLQEGLYSCKRGFLVLKHLSTLESLCLDEAPLPRAAIESVASVYKYFGPTAFSIMSVGMRVTNSKAISSLICRHNVSSKLI